MSTFLSLSGSLEFEEIGIGTDVIDHNALNRYLRQPTQEVDELMAIALCKQVNKPTRAMALNRGLEIAKRDRKQRRIIEQLNDNVCTPDWIAARARTFLAQFASMH